MVTINAKYGTTVCLTFVFECYIFHEDSNFFACLDRENEY